MAKDKISWTANRDIQDLMTFHADDLLTQVVAPSTEFVPYDC